MYVIYAYNIQPTPVQTPDRVNIVTLKEKIVLDQTMTTTPPAPVDTMPYFTPAQIEVGISDVRQMLRHGERVSSFVANLFETERDGVIEWYEFLDFLLVLKNLKRPLNRTMVETAMKEAKKTGVERPWSFDEHGVCSMPGALDAAKDAFKQLDTNHDGILDKKELYEFRL